MCREPFAPYCQLLGQSWFQCAAAVNISGHDLQQKTTWIDICFYSMSQKRSFCKLYLLSLFCGENHCAMCHLLSRLCFIKLCKDCWNSLGHSFSLHWLLIYRRDSIYLVFLQVSTQQQPLAGPQAGGPPLGAVTSSSPGYQPQQQQPPQQQQQFNQNPQYGQFSGGAQQSRNAQPFNAQSTG